MIKQKLESIKQGDSNLYQHLVQVLKHMVLTNDRENYQLFEYYCQRVKQGMEKQQPINQEVKELAAYVEKMRALVEKPSAGGDGEGEPGPAGYLPNLMEEAKWLEHCGIGFGQQLTYLIFKSLEKFSISKQIKELKFWGKITATHADYYIAQSPAEGAEEELSPDVQPKGQGVNKMTFWVCTDLNDEWKELPIVTPQQLKVSRRVKYLFTGDLERAIFINPHFKGKQAHLLKCQIVRINHSCTLVPRTMYTVKAEEDKKQIQPTEEWKIPQFGFLSSIQNWVHFPANILQNGRLTHLPPEIPEGADVDEEKLKKEIEAKDPFEEPLKPVGEDKLKNGQCAWTLKSYGDCNDYKAIGKSKEEINYGFVCLRSLVWKGWHTVYHQKQWINCYIGNGMKTGDWYFPGEPEGICSESADKEQVSEPNFPPDQPKQEEKVDE